jgi:hypothetical protein
LKKKLFCFARAPPQQDLLQTKASKARVCLGVGRPVVCVVRANKNKGKGFVRPKCV